MPRADSPESFRKLVGAAVKRLRMERGMSQGELGERIAVSYQQIQKYENGETRVSLDRLYQLSQALEVSFYQLLSGESIVGESAQVLRPNTAAETDDKPEMRYRLDDEELRMVKLFRKIENPGLRRVVLSYLRTVVQSDEQS